MSNKRGIQWVKDNVIKVSFGKKKVQKKEIDIDQYLEESGYQSIEEWALDSGCHYDKDEGIWFDEDDCPINIAEKLWYILDSMNEEA